MSWKEVSPGRFDRPFDNLESHYVKIRLGRAPLNREYYSISGTVQIEWANIEEDLENALRNTWKIMRFDYPSIISFALDNTCVYKSLTTKLSSSGSRRPSPLSHHQQTQPSTTYTQHSRRTTTTSPSSTTSPNLQNHAPLLALAHRRHRPNPPPQPSPPNPSRAPAPPNLRHRSPEKALPRLDEVTPIPSIVPPALHKTATAQLMNFLTNLPTKPAQIPSTTQRARLELPGPLTAAIVTASKVYDDKVTTDLHGAIICAIQKHWDLRIPATKYTSLVTYDLRKYCSLLYSDADRVVGVYYTGFRATVVPSSLLENAAQLRDMYVTPLDTWELSLVA